MKVTTCSLVYTKLHGVTSSKDKIISYLVSNLFMCFVQSSFKMFISYRKHRLHKGLDAILALNSRSLRGKVFLSLTFNYKFPGLHS